MNEKYEYVGCFFEPEYFFEEMKRLGEERLSRLIRCPHVTFAFQPEEVDETLFGEDITVTVTGYGNNGKNEGVKVELCEASEGVKAQFEQIEVPHITISVGNGGRPVNTRYLQFEETEPFELIGKYGGYVTKEKKFFVEKK